MRGEDRATLVAVLQKARAYLALPGNDFCWSTWKNQDECLAEVDKWIAHVVASDRVETLTLEVLFAPTGDIQEVSMSSGWVQEYLEFAASFDAAIEPFKR